MLFSQLPSLLSSRVEKFSIRKYEENGEKQRKGMVSVLEMLREKFGHPFYKEISHNSGYRPWGTMT